MEIKNPAFNYDKFGQAYSGIRQTDPRIAAFVHRALGDSKTILNVGAGTGSYEPADRYVLALEPSQVMRAQRKDKVPAVIGKADALPFDENAFDAVMAMITIHHWPDLVKGLQEMRRVAKDQVVILTCDPDALPSFWSGEYFPELAEIERQRFPKIGNITEALGGNCDVKRLPVALDCIDGFIEAFYGRPEALLERKVRQGQSSWGFLKEGMEEVLVKRLSDDLRSGSWDNKFGAYRSMPFMTGSLTLITARPGS